MALLPKIKADHDTTQATQLTENTPFEMEIDGVTYDFIGTVFNPFNRAAPTAREQGAANALNVAAKRFARFAKIGDESIIGHYHGFEIVCIIPNSAQRWRNLQSLDVMVELRASASDEIKPNKMHYAAIVKEIEQKALSLNMLAEAYMATIERNKLDIANAQAQQGQPFPFADELTALEQRIHEVELLLAEIQDKAA